MNIDNPYIITHQDPDSPVSEEYRNVKSMIIRMTRERGLNNTLIVTSAFSGEGKSISSLNLAITLAQDLDHTVLLIDADLRGPTLHKYLNIQPRIGLSDCLVDGIDIGEAIVKTDIEKLRFLPAGRSIGNPAELLSSNIMKQLIAEMKNRYENRYVVIDTSPVLPFAETRAMSKAVDGIVLVVREGTVSLQDIQDTVDVLDRGKVIGILYNVVNMENMNGRYRYYRNGSSYYKKDKKDAGQLK